MNNTHHYEQLIEIFNGCFADEFNTRLIKGDDEPIYLPADARNYRITVSFLRMVITPVLYTKFHTGASPVKPVVSWSILVTGTARTDATRRHNASLKMWK